MALPTISSSRSGLLFNLNPGGLPFISDARGLTGNVWFVMTGGTDAVGYGRHPDAPFATIDYAIGQCTANQGDVIFVMPGHAETLATAGAIAADVAGVSIIGLGQGANRPTLSLSATGSTIAVSAASVTFQNLRVTSTVNELVKIFNITAADCTIDAVDYIDPGAAFETLQFALTDSGADRLTIKNCVHYASTAGATAQLWIALVGCDQPRILDNTFILKLADAATSSVINGDASVTMAELGRNRIHLTGYSASLLSAVLMTSGATGIHYDSRIYADVAAVTSINDFATGASFEVYCSNDADKNGILDPVVGS